MTVPIYSEGKKVVFLFGAGISIPVKIQSTTDITKRIFEDDNLNTIKIIDHNTPSKTSYPRRCTDKRLKAIIEKIRDIIGMSYKSCLKKHGALLMNGAEPNYEDIYYVCSELDLYMQGFSNNPFMAPFCCHLKASMGNLNDDRIGELCRQALEYIKNTVRFSLAEFKKCNLHKLSMISDACQDNDFASIDIFTLNHDLVLEELLKPIGFCDGFGRVDGEFRIWDGSLFSEGNKVRLFKLHGSIDWYSPISDEWDMGFNNIVKPEDKMKLKGYDFFIKNAAKKSYHCIQPMMLIGSMNKIVEYNTFIYHQMFAEFGKSLQKTDRLIVSGYGFGDAGINRLIASWLYFDQRHSKKVIIIHPDEVSVKYCNFRMDISLKDRIINGGAEIIPKRIEATNWEETKNKIFR